MSDDVVTLAILGERLNNVMTNVAALEKKIDSLATRRDIEEFVSRAEHAASITEIKTRIDALELTVKYSSVRHIIDSVTKAAIAISAIGACGAWLWHTVRAVP